MHRKIGKISQILQWFCLWSGTLVPVQPLSGAFQASAQQTYNPNYSRSSDVHQTDVVARVSTQPLRNFNTDGDAATARLLGLSFKIEQIFPDLCLQTAVKRIFKDNPDIQALETIETLQLDHLKINDLTGIDQLTNVTSISLSGNYVRDVVKLSLLLKIQALDLRNNRISNPSPLNRLLYLTQLNLSGNDIKYTFGCSYLNLKELDISHNKIDQLLGTKGTNLLLEKVDVSDNPLQDIPGIFYAPSLRVFKANNTFIENIRALMECPKLEVLEVEHCPHFKSLKDLFRKDSITRTYTCTFQKLRELTFSEEFLDAKSREMLKEIVRDRNIDRVITINNQSVVPKRSVQPVRPTQF